MLISKPMAALIGGLLFAAVLGFIPKGCAHQPQPAKQALAIAQPLPLPLPTNPDPWAGISDQERLRGDAEIPPIEQIF